MMKNSVAQGALTHFIASMTSYRGRCLRCAHFPDLSSSLLKDGSLRPLAHTDLLVTEVLHEMGL